MNLQKERGKDERRSEKETLLKIVRAESVWAISREFEVVMVLPEITIITVTVYFVSNAPLR